jgi:medium-chain acyl-[acyl-carrier-protein] hydrolase
VIPGQNPWLLDPPDEDTAAERLFCFPHAGAGASVFAPWRPHLPDSVALFRVQPPGRENRFRDPMPNTLEESTKQVAQALLPLLRPPYVLFGHCSGGLSAYALATYLHEQGHPLPRTLVISGTRPPHVAPEIPYHTLARDELLGFLRATNGIHPSLLEHEELVSHLLDVLRTDLRLDAEYMSGSAAPLPCDVRVFAAEDDHIVQATLMKDWRHYAAGEFSVHQEAGGHLSVYDVSGDLFAAVIRSGLARR